MLLEVETTRRWSKFEAAGNGILAGVTAKPGDVILQKRLRHRGGRRVAWIFTFTAAAYNLVRLRTLLPQGP